MEAVNVPIIDDDVEVVKVEAVLKKIAPYQCQRPDKQGDR